MKIFSLWLVAALLLCASLANAQTYTPTYSTKLEFKNGTFKLLISPSAVNANDTLTLPAFSSPGALVNDGTGLLSWTPMTSPSWHLIGNTGTNPDSNFIGTIDSVSVIHKTNNIEQLRVRASGGVSLPPTEASGRGVVYVDTVRFMHSYGSNNAFLGGHAGNLALTGNSNTGLGSGSLINLGTGDSNTAVGRGALDRINNDFHNTAVGAGALSTLESGNNNTAIGVNSGIGDTVSSNNTMIGAYATIGDLRDNATAIGYRAFADLDNTVVLGSISGINGATDDTYIGIGTTQPGEKFEMANGNMILSNTNNLSPMFCIQEPSDSGFAVVSLMAPSLNNGNVFLTLPATEGDEFSVLSSDGTGVMSWINPVSDFATLNAIVRRDTNTGGFTAGRIVITEQNGIRFNDLDDSQYVAIIPPAAITSTYTLTLPETSAQGALYNDGTGALSWATMTPPSWNLLGNSGTDPDSNFIGTTDSVSVILKTNNIEQLRIRASGGVNLPPTDPSGRGIVYVDSVRFMHSYGVDNTFLGADAGNLALTGDGNTGLGNGSLINLGSGDSNTAIGLGALDQISNDFRNTAIGAGALSELQSGSDNVAIGAHTGTGDTTGSNNTMIGAHASVGDQRENATAIGSYAYADLNDVVVLGAIAGVNGATLDAYVGIGTSQPTEKFEIMNGDIIVTNTTGSSGTICIQEPSDSGFAVVSLLAPPIPGDGDVWLWLPPNQGDPNSVLSSNGSGWMFWQNPVSEPNTFNTIVRRDTNTGGFTAGRIVVAGQSGIRFNDLDDSQYVEIIPQASLTSSYTLTLPPNDGLTGQFLQTDGSGGLSWDSVHLAEDITGILPVQNGGTGLDGSAAANGELLIGNGTGFVLATLTGTTDQITVTNGAGSITLSTPQDIATTSSPTFDSLILTNNLNMTNGNINDVNTISATGETLIVNDSLQVTGNVVPTTTLLYSLGTDDLRWTEAYVSGTSVHIGPSGGENAGTELSIGYAANAGSVNVNGGTAELSLGIGTVTLPNFASAGVVHNAAGGLLSSSLIVTADITDANVTLAKIANASVNDVLVGSGNSGANSSYTEISLGSSLSMLGTTLAVNLANANTWTATQTLPTTAAQGDALIASVNAGTTTIDAARIGVGLSDPQVNNNLTISGGTVDNSPVGATTASTGRFTTIEGTTLPSASASTNIVTSNGGALETRTIASLNGSVAVSTNASLVGDGTTGNPLGLNLANANTWTATQTLPATAAQGDALIASVNAGTTTINAARIGAGLTNAQVNDNLTISGGTVDNSPVGATTASTGRFTTIEGTTLPSASASTDLVTSNAGVLETRTFASLAGSIGVSTNASLVGDGTTGDPLGLNLANANTWTATQTLPATAAQGDALIASVNAGTTTIDAARIGAGLTNAQVNDNLTINGGTVDATPIGGTTPSTGAFTTITGSGTTTLSSLSTAGVVHNDASGVLSTSLIVTADITDDNVTFAKIANASANDVLIGSGNTGSGTDYTEITLGNNLSMTAAQLNVVANPTFTGMSLTGDLNMSGNDIGNVAMIDNNTNGVTVNDALIVIGAVDISSGTIDGTSIGATTPSSGSFTTITGTTLPSASASTDIVTSNAGALETRTAASLAGSFSGAVAVSTDASLVGDGTTGNPLGLNLANANTWTATQTLPTTAAQGDALIASVNAGTTTIDAARIGAGLTDAQVNDNLTINGGTVDASPIGATTPSTGSFTTITGTALPSASASTDIVTSNAGALETRTIASLGGSIAVSTDASLVGDGTTGNPLGLNLANANTWTATQTLPVTAAQGDALIASVNAGTTTIDAARIGAGLTDAQVNDNLTIDGGTVDNSPVGATTASTGRFTTIEGTTLPAASASGDIVTSNAGSLETRTIASLGGSIAVSTDATLAGDGTTGTPLGLNLANANTWTATQTLPVTAAQGDDLIASVNAGTTTIDAARIGAGLTDAQVNDNLTIDGGTVDNSPIGVTIESSGRFTTAEATTVLGAASTPNAGTYYRDNATIAWGDIAASGVVNDQFGNSVLAHTPGTGVYTVTLPNAPTAAATTVTLQSLGLTTVTRAGAVLTITTYDTTGTPTDLDFYFITTGRP
jgi:nitrogen fixation protein FixH